MAALGTTSLIFLCYSKETTVVMEAYFDNELWQLFLQSIQTTYGADGFRPKKKPDNSTLLLEKITQYMEEKVVFKGEVKSVTGQVCPISSGNIEAPFCDHKGRSKSCTLCVDDVLQLMFESQAVFNESYKLTRQRATEFLGFLLSDLDRNVSHNGLYSLPIAFGMKGNSLPCKILREMIEHVLDACSKAGLYVPVCSFDGQWYRIAVRDQNEFPLTLLQLQKDIYHEVKRMSVSEITNKICNMNLVSVDTIDQKIDVQRTINGLVVISKTLETLAISQNIMHMIESWKQGKLRKELIRNEQTQTNVDIQRTLSSLPSEIVHEIPSETLAEAFQSNNQRKPEEIDDVMKYVDENSLATLESGASSTTIDISDNINVEENLDFQQNTEDVQSENDTLLTKTDIENMHFSLKRSKNSKKKWEMPSTEFLLLFSSATEINKRFTKQELLDMLAPVAGKLASNGIKVLASETKRKLIEKICPILGDGSTLPDPPKRTRGSPKSLRAQARSIVNKLPKDILCALYAENICERKYESWTYFNPFGKYINVEGIPDFREWYSMPEFNKCTGNYVFMILDTYHQLCGLRRLVCQKGIPSRGIKRSAFVKIAEENETNGCGLSPAMVNDLIDKQSVAFALGTFNLKVADALDTIGATEEADFCRMVFFWYSAEDDPGIPAIDRCKYRLRFRDWLLKDVCMKTYPPYGSFINDIPVVLFEGLLTNIERKIQLFPFTKSGGYNVRAVGSLDAENFFGTFQDIDPKGTGVFRPDDIPSALAVAAELIDSKLDPNR